MAYAFGKPPLQQGLRVVKWRYLKEILDVAQGSSLICVQVFIEDDLEHLRRQPTAQIAQNLTIFGIYPDVRPTDEFVKLLRPP